MDARLEGALALLEGAVGAECWSVMASERTDYVLVLDLGARVRRSLRLANPRLSFLQRTYEGERGFLIECPWRLDGPRGVVVSCFDSAARGGRMLGGLAELEGRRLTAVRVAHAAHDLTLELEGGYALRALSTEVAPKTRRGNWSSWSPEGMVAVGARGALVQETRAEAARRLRAIAEQAGADDDDPPPNVVDDE